MEPDMSIPVKHDGMTGFIPQDQQGPIIPPYYEIVTGLIDNYCWHSTATGWGRVNKNQPISLYDLVIRRRADAPQVVPHDPNEFGWNRSEKRKENEMLAMREDLSMVKQMLMQLGSTQTLPAPAVAPALPAPAVAELTVQMKQLTDVFQSFGPLFTALVGKMQEQASRLDKQTLGELKAFQKRLDEYKECGWVSSPLTHDEVSWIMKIVNKFR